MAAAAAATDTKPVRVAILGASGYTGAELVRLLLGHTGVKITVLTGNTQAGQAFSAVYPQFHYAKVRQFQGLQMFLHPVVVTCCDLPARIFFRPEFFHHSTMNYNHLCS